MFQILIPTKIFANDTFQLLPLYNNLKKYRASNIFSQHSDLNESIFSLIMKQWNSFSLDLEFLNSSIQFLKNAFEESKNSHSTAGNLMFAGYIPHCRLTHEGQFSNDLINDERFCSLHYLLGRFLIHQSYLEECFPKLQYLGWQTNPLHSLFLGEYSNLSPVILDDIIFRPPQYLLYKKKWCLESSEPILRSAQSALSLTASNLDESAGCLNQEWVEERKHIIRSHAADRPAVNNSCKHNLLFDALSIDEPSTRSSQRHKKDSQAEAFENFRITPSAHSSSSLPVPSHHASSHSTQLTVDSAAATSHITSPTEQEAGPCPTAACHNPYQDIAAAIVADNFEPYERALRQNAACFGSRVVLLPLPSSPHSAAAEHQNQRNNGGAIEHYQHTGIDLSSEPFA